MTGTASTIEIVTTISSSSRVSRVEHADAGGRAEQHECELAALPERDGEPLAFVAGNPRGGA